jgi:hypothetical protein
LFVLHFEANCYAEKTTDNSCHLRAARSWLDGNLRNITKEYKKQKESGEEDQNLGTKILKNFFTVLRVAKTQGKSITQGKKFSRQIMLVILIILITLQINIG